MLKSNDCDILELFKKLYSSSEHCVYLPPAPGWLLNISGLKVNFSEASDKAAIKKRMR